MAIISIKTLSVSLGREVTFNVIYPSYHLKNMIRKEEPDFEPKAYPMLIALNALTGDANDFLHYSSLARYAMDKDVVIVMPSGENSGYSNHETGAKYFTYVTEELPKLAARMLHVSIDPKNINLLGTSMGAWGVMKMACAFPEKYGHVFMLSAAAPVLEESNSTIAPGFNLGDSAYGGYLYGLEKHLIGTVEDAYYMMKVNEGKVFPEFHLYVGSQDYLLKSCRLARDAFEAHNIPCDYREIPGYGHVWEFWDLMIKDIIETWY